MKLNNWQHLKTAVPAFVMAVLLVIIDQATKLWAINNLKGKPAITVIPGFLDFSYLENTGAAFGIFKGHTIILGVVTAIILGIMLIMILSGKINNKFVVWTLALIIAGGIGNVIDRFRYDYVVDFIDVTWGILRNFPVFNFADICVTVGAVLIILYIAFVPET